MSKNVRYWLWLQAALGAGAPIKEIINELGGAKEIYNMSILDWRMSPALTSKQVDRLSTTNINDVEEIIYSCKQNEWDIIDYDDSRYPKRLKEIINPPAVLYVEGDLPDIDSLACIGVVGTRKASDYSIRATDVMCKGIAEAGALIISGGALGVDSASHKAALICGKKTVAVLGCGFGTNYLKSNDSLRSAIKENGALITEYPPYTSASKRTFPLRNRIISGLSLGVLVVEAGERSGSLITARYAVEQNRDVFAIPAPITDTDYSGTNKLISDGAMVAVNPESIIGVYKERFDYLDASHIKSINQYMSNKFVNAANTQKEDAKVSFDSTKAQREARIQKEYEGNGLTGALKVVFEALEIDYIHLDDISERTKISADDLIPVLTELEILGLVNGSSGSRYKLA